MDTTQLTSIKDLRPVEQVLAYLYQHNLPFTTDALHAYEEQIKAALHLTHLPAIVEENLSNGVLNYREDFISENILKHQRVELFLHPRFAPITAHAHSYFEIKYLLSGKATVAVAGQSISMEAGDFVFIAPNTEHMVAIYDAETLLINVIITADAAASAFPRIYFSENPISQFFTAFLQNSSDHPYLLCRTGTDEILYHMVTEAYQKRRTTGPVPACLFCESFLEHLMLELLSSHSEQFELPHALPPVPEKLFPILGYINDHCATVNLVTLSRVFNYSTAHLSRLIKQHTGKTFSSLLRSARLTQASFLLRSSDLSIQEIILRTGYTGKANFYRVFQDTFSMTPAQFRNSEVPLDDMDI